VKKSFLMMALMAFVASSLCAKSLVQREKNAHASMGGKLGLGIIAGNPSGFHIKYWIDRQWTVSSEVGFPGSPTSGLPSIGGSGLGGSVDLAWHQYEVFGKRTSLAYNLPLYFGGGVWTYIPNGGKDGSQNMLGARGVIGATYLFATAPFDLFVQFCPSVVFAPEGSRGIATVHGGGLGAHAYF
jgi:hypothetical protein